MFSKVQIYLKHLNFEKNAFIVETRATEYFPSKVYCTLMLHAMVGLSPKGICFNFQGLSRYFV